jgi:hypothetical protein
MNPNADVFRYEPAAGNVPEAVRQVQSGESVVPSMVTGSMTQATGSFPGMSIRQIRLEV